MRKIWRDWQNHPVSVLIILVAFVSTMTLAGLGLSSCTGTRQVTVGGVLTQDETMINAANRIYNAETAYVLASEALLVLREPGGPLYGPEYDARWDQIADASDSVVIAIAEAKAALVEYERQQSTTGATALSRMLAVLDHVGRRLLAFTER